MNPTFVNGIAGLIGGILRSIIGTLKALKRGEKFRIHYFIFSVVSSGLLGLFCGIVFGENYKFSLLIGYMGMDFIEGLYKIKYGKSIL